ncbi:MAG TPA: hypothetical protein VIW94_10180 [Acidimicrobiia bacterium]
MTNFLVLAALVLVSCSGDRGADPDDGFGSGADSAEEAVTELLVHLSSGEFSAAVPLTIPGQAALASLAEGATVEDVANGLRDGDETIANNFWSGFAQTVEPALLEAPAVIGSSPATVEDVAFTVVTVSGGAVERTFTTRDLEGHRIDIFATFGPSLAARLYAPVERLFESTDPDAAFILGELREQVPALHMAAQTPGLAPNVVQDILQLIELITRIN